MPCETPSAEKFAASFVYGSSLREALQDFKPLEVASLQQKICETVIRKFGNNPVRSTMQAILCTAVKKSSAKPGTNPSHHSE
jgi:hypothetical protein